LPTRNEKDPNFSEDDIEKAVIARLREAGSDEVVTPVLIDKACAILDA
jgi:hypothetical protein